MCAVMPLFVRMIDETHLISKAKAGDRQAFEQLLLPHLPTLLAYSRAICGDFHAAQDVVQDTALIAYRNLERFFVEADFAIWLKAIARRQALAARRKLGRHKLAAEALLEAAYEPDEEGDTSQQSALQDCLEKLPPASLELIRIRYTEGSGIEDIASKTNTNVDTLRWRMYRLRLGLRDCVERQLRQEGWT